MNSNTISTLRIPLFFTPPQLIVYNGLRRYNSLVTGRRWGKSHFGLNLGINYSVSNSRSLVWYVAPTYRQAKLVAWEYLLFMATRTNLKYVIQNINKADLELFFKNGSIFSLKGADNPDSLRGTGLILAILDEYASMAKEVLDEIIRPALSDKLGNLLLMGTPKGFNHFYDTSRRFHRNRDKDPVRSRFNSWDFTSIDGGWISEEEILEAKETLSDRVFNQEYLGSFETFAGQICYNFSRQNNVREDISLPRDGQELLVGMDFNVNPMSACIGYRTKSDCFHIFDDISLPNSNTVEMSIEIKKRYGWREETLRGIENGTLLSTSPPDKRIIKVFPDPSGGARHTSNNIGDTDHIILTQHGFQVFSPRVAPLRVDRYNTVNAILKNAKNETKLFIHPRAENVIKSLEGLGYKDGTNEADTSGGLDHMFDALGYVSCEEFPMLLQKNAVSKMLG